MLINNTEALKSWLVVVLAPLCDADSSALARYVLALLKKDKPEKELKRVMIEQLDVFLGEETTPFVERLFAAINTKEYLAMSTIATQSTTITSPVVKLEDFDLEENITIQPPIPLPINNQQMAAKADNTEANPPPADVQMKNSAYTDNTKTISSDEHKTKEPNHQTSANDVCVNNHQYKVGNSATEAAGSSSSNNSNQRHIEPSRNAGSMSTLAVADKENQPRESRRRRASFHSRSRSRSRSQERFTRRSRSPRDRRGNTRQFRNKSPASSSHERRRGSFVRGERQRVTNTNSNAENTRKSRNPHSSTSPSPDRRTASTATIGTSKSISTLSGSGNLQEHEQISGEKRQRCRDFDEKGYCVRGETCPWDHGVNPVVFESLNNSALITMSLREYNPDAPDLWSRSGSGTNLPAAGLVVATTAPGNINPFTGAARGNAIAGPAVPGGSLGFPCVPAGVNIEKSVAPPNDYVRGGPPVGYRGASAPLMPFPFNAAPLQQRELIPIPVVDAETGSVANVTPVVVSDISNMSQQPAGKRRFDMMEDHTASGIADAGPTKRKVPLNCRLGPRAPINMQNNCSLELRKVPRGLNTIAHLNNHFVKFGKIVNIQISYEGDPEAAIVTFSTHAEANVAYRSTEAVLNNRFIKVFWHTEPPVINDANTNNSVNGARKNNHHYHLNNLTNPLPGATTNNIVATVESAVTKPTAAKSPAEPNKSNNNTSNNSGTAAKTNDASNPTTMAATHMPVMSLRLKNNLPARTNVGNAGMRKKQEEQVKAVVQLANGLRKRKQELLQSYVKQMKSALELVERCEHNDPQRVKTLETVKVLQETIDKLRKEIAAEQEAQISSQQQQHPVTGLSAVSSTPPPTKKTKEQQKKELLDIELELFAQQQEGNDITAIQRRLEELQRNLGIVTMAGCAKNVGATKLSNFGGISRASQRAVRGTMYPEGPTRVDRRPKTIIITGFAAEEADFVLGHFKHFGEILKNDVDKEIPQLILSYATRMSAEQAVLRGKMYKGKRLQISWAPVISNNNTANTQANEASSNVRGNHANKQETIKTEDGNMLSAENKEEFETKPVISKTAGLTSTAEEKHVELILSEKLSNDDALLPELRLEDEEEDEECEDRSWRR